MPYGFRMLLAWGVGFILMFCWLFPALWMYGERMILSDGIFTWLSYYEISELWKSVPLLLAAVTLAVLPSAMVMKPGLRGLRLGVLVFIAAAVLLSLVPHGFNFNSYPDRTLWGSFFDTANTIAVGHNDKRSLRPAGQPFPIPDQTPRMDQVKGLAAVAGVYATIGGPALLLLWLPPLLVYGIEWLKEWPFLRRILLSGCGGSARWAGPRTFSRNKHKRGEPVLGMSKFEDDFAGRRISGPAETHTCTIGATGSGKTATVIENNLLSVNASAYVSDPKGEHSRLTLGFRQDANIKKGTNTGGISRVPAEARLPGGHAYARDPYGIGAYPTSNYNPLSEINIEDHFAATMINVIGRACVHVSSGDNKFWEETTRAVLEGAIAHVMSTRTKAEQTLPAVADMLLGLNPETGFADPDRLKETLIEMRMNSAVGGLPQRAAMMFDNLGERAYGNVTAELVNSLKWCTDPAMRVQLSSSDFKLEDMFVGPPMTVYDVLPIKAMTEKARWLRINTELMIAIGLRYRDTNPKPDPKPILFLDELPQFGKECQGIKEGLVTVREVARIWAFVQHHNQLVECFGEEGARNFESSGTLQIFGCNDAVTAAWASTKLGYHTFNHKKWFRWKCFFWRRTTHKEQAMLVDPAIICQQLQNHASLQYVFPSDGAPMRLERLAFKRMKIGKTKFRKMPGVAKADNHLRP